MHSVNTLVKEKKRLKRFIRSYSGQWDRKREVEEAEYNLKDIEHNLKVLGIAEMIKQL